MKDVLFYFNYTPVGDVSTIVLCVIYWLLLHSSYAIKQKSLTMFNTGNALIFLAAFTNITFHVLIDDMTAGTVPWIYVFRNITYLSLMLTYIIFCIYIGNIVGVSGIHKKLLNAALIVPFLIFALLEIISPATHFGFYIDKQLQIHQNYYTDIFRFAYVYYTVVMCMLLAVYRKRFIAKMFRCICCVMAISFLIMVLQAELLSTSYMCITFTFPFMVVLFLFHHNSYDSQNGTLDGRVFDTYIKDLEERRFSMVFLFAQGVTAEETKEFSRDFLHFNEHFFRQSCIFRLGDNKLVTVYEDEKNKSIDGRIQALLEDFSKNHEKYRLDYRIVFLHSDKALSEGRDYLALDEFVEKKMPLNTIHCCEQREIEGYLKEAYILEELQDICARKDLDDERVLVFCQPVLNTATNTFTSAEALMRIKLPECGMVFPDQFIPLAEKHEYIHMLSKIILHKTCRQLKQLEQEGYQIERISVNFSILELRDKNFCEDVIGIIQSNAVDCGKIAIELTESRNEKDFENVKSIMTNLQSLGVKFYLDDFGTGYSNFERIIGLPIDIIKFDRSLTILAGKDESSRYMVGSFSDIFKRSNYQILFEGVEDEKDEVQCKEMNALYLQGYKYSKPIPIEELKNFLKKAS